MARLHVGLSVLHGDLDKYASRFDMVELRPIDTPMPRVASLRKWRKSAPPAFAFSVVLPKVVGELTPSNALDEALAHAVEVAASVEARCIVLHTPPGIRPTTANKKRLAAVFERIPPEGTVRCWEASGIWERDEILFTARELGVLPVFDAAREALASGPIAYTRLRALGKTATLGSSTIERVADRLRKRRETFVVVEGSREAQRVRAALVAALAKRERAPTSTIVRPSMSSQLIAEDEEQ